ncbi:winged helix-turn-helix domain-containing protein [Prolixibacter denitrificans]|uniref:Transcriptional regulator n=1 Tax=Prolixibacter denitrificans TaxID=1541063 RepID=A0A2P8CCM4_9BACT|nr:transcriptional regulator [Prolixibacter denitrificans]PSK82723.1 winged helix DNA-binding protein [Prolixibacter denitrificans]GET21455.1 transcriptional regulator [Prolixibacter denitrificans]
MRDIVNQLNKAFESRVRLGIMSILMVNEHVSYNRLKELLGVTDGNLASHLKALEKLEYILVEKSFVDRKPHTTYNVSKLGRQSFKEHIDALENLLKGK